MYPVAVFSRRLSLAYHNGASVAYNYSPAGDLSPLTHSIAGAGPSYTFGYTNAHQLQSEAISDSTYAWQPGASATDTYAAANTLNQYPSWTPAGGSSIPFTYDGKANLTGGTIGGGAWAFNYDAENRLLTADKTVGGTVHAAYAYDPLGRRTHKSGTGVTETYFLSDGTDEIFEYNSAGTPNRRIVPGPAIDEPIFQASGTGLNTRLYFHTNHQGSVIAMSNASNALAQGPYVYDPFGNCFSGGSPCGSTGEPYRFTGRRFDPETGLLYYRARYYSPVIGRFLQTDPVGYKADLNLYTYVGNDPTDNTDPRGADPNCPRAAPNCGGGESVEGMEGCNANNGGCTKLDLAEARNKAAQKATGRGTGKIAAVSYYMFNIVQMRPSLSERDQAYLDEYFAEVSSEAGTIDVNPAFVLGVGIESGFADNGTYLRTGDAFGMTGGSTKHMERFSSPDENVLAWFKQWGARVSGTGNNENAFINALEGEDPQGHAVPGQLKYNSKHEVYWKGMIRSGIGQMQRDLPIYEYVRVLP